MLSGEPYQQASSREARRRRAPSQGLYEASVHDECEATYGPEENGLVNERLEEESPAKGPVPQGPQEIDVDEVGSKGEGRESPRFGKSPREPDQGRGEGDDRDERKPNASSRTGEP